jgi:hypothetical protein
MMEEYLLFSYAMGWVAAVFFLVIIIKIWN